MTIVNNALACFKVAERIDLKSSHNKKKCFNNIWWCMLTRHILVIILQYLQILNLYIVHMKLIQCHMSIICQLKKEWLNREKNNKQLYTIYKRLTSGLGIHID